MAFIFVTKKGSSDAKIRIWNMDGQRSIPLWRAAAEYRSRGPDVLKGHTKAVVGLAACKNLVYVQPNHKSKHSEIESRVIEFPLLGLISAKHS
jgi:hypothetical protein